MITFLYKYIKEYLQIKSWDVNYRRVVMKEIYGSYDRRHVYVLKYFCNAAFLKKGTKSYASSVARV